MQNILQEEEYMKIIRQDANQLIPSLDTAYYGLLIYGKYLPKLTSSFITSDYLLGVIFDKIYVPRLEEVQIGVYQILQQNTKSYRKSQRFLFNDKYGGLIQKEPRQRLGNKCTKDSETKSDYFQQYKQESKHDMKLFTQEQYNKIKELDLSMGKKSNVRRFFRISKDKQLEAGQFKKNLKKKQLEVQIKLIFIMSF